MTTNSLVTVYLYNIRFIYKGFVFVFNSWKLENTENAEGQYQVAK